MRRILCAIAGVALGASAAVAQPPSLEEFAKQPNLAGLNMSRDGNYMAGLIAEPGSNNERFAVAVWDLTGEIDSSKPLTPNYVTPTSGEMIFNGARVYNGGRVVIGAQQPWTGANPCSGEGAGTGSNSTWVGKTFWTDYTLEKFEDSFAGLGKSRARASYDRECFNLFSRVSVYSTLPLEPDYALVSTYDPVRDETLVYKVNMKTEERERYPIRETGQGSATLIDPRTGQPIAYTDLESRGGNWEVDTYLWDFENKRWEREAPLTIQVRDRYTMNVVGRDEQSGQYYVITDKFSDKAAAYFYNAKTDSFSSDPIFAHPDFETTDVILGSRPSDFNVPLGFTYGSAEGSVYWLDGELAAIQDGLNQAFPGKSVSISSANEDRSRIIFTTSLPGQPVNYMMLLNKAEVVVIGGAKPWLKEDQLGTTELVYYTARDGLKIPALLTMPPGWKKGDAPVPTVVMPHGGPWVRDYIGYDFWLQSLVAQNVAVLQPQYRGSQGFGRKLWLAGDEEWGQKMQDDKDDGLLWMINEGMADPQRTAIMGFSYGGYAAFAAVLREESPYTCSIGGAGVGNVELFRRLVSENRIGRELQGWTLKGLDPIENAEAASKKRMPILIFHGDRDVRVPPEEGRRFYDAVKNYTDATYFEIKDMPHGFPTPRMRREMLTGIFNFLNEKCGFDI